MANDQPITIDGLTLRPSVRKRWVEALRSGDYAQGKGRLRTGDAYCCLGVLCDLYKDEAGLSWEEDPSQGETSRYNIGTATALVVGPIAEVIPNGEELNDDEVAGYADTLAGLNDEGFSFAQIADLIEGKKAIV